MPISELWAQRKRGGNFNLSVVIRSGLLPCGSSGKKFCIFLDESPSLKPYLLAAKAKSCQTDLDLTSEKTFPTYKVFKDCPAIYPSSGEDIVAGEFFSGEASALAQSLQAELDGESNS